MNINNYYSNVPDNIKQVFDSYVPFGSDFVYYCVSNTTGLPSEYIALYRPIGSDQLKQVTAIRSGNNNTFVFSLTDKTGSLDGVTVAHPEYAYSNLVGAGRYYDPPSGSGLVVVCVVVLACLSILRTVFGGIKWFRLKRYRV